MDDLNIKVQIYSDKYYQVQENRWQGREFN